MFTENGTTYKDALDYAEQNETLVWTEVLNTHEALNKHYIIFDLPSGTIMVFAGRISWKAPDIESAKQECQADYNSTYGKF